MTNHLTQSKTREQLEAEILALTQEVAALRHPANGTLADNQRRMTETLHNLQVHQEELRAQNEELRQAQDNLEKISSRYRDLFEYSPVGYFIIGDSVTVMDANIAGMSMLGRTKGRLAGKPFLLFVEKNSRPDLDEHFATVRSGRRGSTEVWLTPDQGAPFPVILESVQLGDGWGGGWRCLTTALDITDRKRAELALRESETRFRAIFEQSPLAIQIVDNAAVPRMSNRAWVKMWGQASTLAVPVGSHQVLGMMGAKEHLTQGLAGHSVEIPATHVAADSDGNADRWVHGYIYPIHGQGEAIPEVVLVNEDVSDRKRIELALADRTELLRRQYENLRVLGEIAALPPSSSSLRLAEALALGRRHLDLSTGLISRVEGSHFTIEHHSAPTEAGVIDGTVLDHTTTYCALALEHGDVVAIAHMAFSPYADHSCYLAQRLESYIGVPISVGGKPYGAVSFSSPAPSLRDFDEGDKEFMRLLARWIGAVLEEGAIRRDLAQSNAELEQFAYVASHDLRQPLRQVASYVSLLERRYRDKLDAEAQEFIAYARDGAMHMDQLIVDLLEFSRIGRNAKPISPVALRDVVHEAIANLNTSLADVGGRIDVQSDLPTVIGNASDLVRLFQNLIGNAIKYSLPDRPPVVVVTAKAKPMSHVVTVRDNGIGISSEYFDTIFGVFKRLHTPDKYEGNGIGLAICKKVMDQHNGRIWIESIPGVGSAFHVELPRSL
jgi:PAS domain S-box-containing protein